MAGGDGEPRVRHMHLIDTSIMCIILKVPGRNGDHDTVVEEMKELIEDDAVLLLPMATIIETGNHIAHFGDGNLRRKVAEKFVKAVLDAVDGKAPWTPTPMFEIDALKKWLSQFPDSAMRGEGLGDLSIIQDYHRQCKLHPDREVRIWSLDSHLSAYVRPGSNI